MSGILGGIVAYKSIETNDNTNDIPVISHFPVINLTICIHMFKRLNRPGENRPTTPEEHAAEPGGEGFVVETKVGARVCPKMGEPSWEDKFVFVFFVYA